MSSVEEAVREEYAKCIAWTDMHEVNERLRHIAASDDGLGVALLVAWQHGLRIGHIPRMDDTSQSADSQAKTIASTDECPYRFVYVDVRQFRRDQSELTARGIMDPDADPAWFIYHEDGLVGTFSFHNPESVKLTKRDIGEILEDLALQGVLVRANINNRQIQFKDPASKRHIEASGEKVYVRIHDRPLVREKVRLPSSSDPQKVWDYVERALQKRSACNYCSAQALLPHEATVHSTHVNANAERWEDDLATVRNYQMGFTFAPFGDPRDVCHFAAWDFPHINDLVMNMEPQAYSFSDLIRLVRVINQDIAKFCESHHVETLPEPISGVCNHWAGNSIYHQHYQFFRIADLPLTKAADEEAELVTADTQAELLVQYGETEVRKVAKWPSPAFRISSLKSEGGEAEVMAVADRVAREWGVLSEGEDLSYGNGIAIKNHTQNLFVTTAGGKLSAFFIPRHRGKLNTAGPKNSIQKSNAGVLEMMGYFIIDNLEHFRTIQGMSGHDRGELGRSWLEELAPNEDTILEFEDNVRICLSKGVTEYEDRIDRVFSNTLEDMKREAWAFASSVQRDERLHSAQRAHLYREFLSAMLEARTGDSSPVSPG